MLRTPQQAGRLRRLGSVPLAWLAHRRVRRLCSLAGITPARRPADKHVEKKSVGPDIADRGRVAGVR
jgi:hypothetical protein